MKIPYPTSLSESRNPKDPKESKRGVAIIMALMIISFMVGFIADLVISSRVANQMSINLEDRLKAEYLARSGFNLASFLVSIDWGIDLKMHEMTKQKVTDGSGDFWSFLNGLPIGSSEVKMLAGMKETFGLSDVMDSDVLSQLDLFGGSFVIDVADEDSKINVNYLLKENTSKNTVYPMLVSLFSCPAEKEFLDRKELTPEKLAARIADYIDTNKRVRAGAEYSEESSPYEDKIPKRGPKNLPLDSIDELKLVDGWDDDVHAVFAPYLTVFPIIKEYYPGLKDEKLEEFARVNINTSSRAFLGCLFSEMNIDCRENFAVQYAKAREEQQNFSDGSDLKNALKSLACYDQSGDSKKEDWFRANSYTFRIKTMGLVGDQQRTLDSVVYRVDPDVMKKQKINNSLDLLYWSMR